MHLLLSHSGFMKKRDTWNRTLSVLVFLSSLVLGACYGQIDEGFDYADGEQALAESEFLGGEDGLSAHQDFDTEAAKDCFVRITCANGSLRSCFGTNGSCSASSSGNGKVTCNGSSSACPAGCTAPSCETQHGRSCSGPVECSPDGGECATCFCQNGQSICPL